MSMNHDECFYCHKKFLVGEWVFHKADRAFTSHARCYRKYKGEIPSGTSEAVRKWEATND